MELIDPKEVKRHIRRTYKDATISKGAFGEMNEFAIKALDVILGVITKTISDDPSLYTYKISDDLDEKTHRLRNSLNGYDNQRKEVIITFCSEWFFSFDEWYRLHTVICPEHSTKCFSICPKMFLRGFVLFNNISQELPENEYLRSFVAHGINQITEWICDVSAKILRGTSADSLKRDDIISIISKTPTFLAITEKEKIAEHSRSESEHDQREELSRTLQSIHLDNDDLFCLYEDDTTTWVGIKKTNWNKKTYLQSYSIQTDKKPIKKKLLVKPFHK
eukprot:GHVP01036681.1.p1 GENE.GHVP01036681.1~~GHVP01036681.1.p1  ORF type:complete len:277 (+),score=38.79 GHVP01036681.1:272-1102(+)